LATAHDSFVDPLLDFLADAKAEFEALVLSAI
jgi:hypothetical protein